MTIPTVKTKPHIFNTRQYLLIIIAAMLHLSGCSVHPVEQFNTLKSKLPHSEFHHETNHLPSKSLYFPKTQPTTDLHVYIEGDGKPWSSRYVRAKEPTSSSLPMLKMAIADPHISIYLGRPCYNGLARDKQCHSDIWTNARYSKKVITHMSNALNEISRQIGQRNIILFGHSGGGTLSMLLTKDLEQLGIKVRAIITLSGNLDINAWAKLHNYSPLQHSLNPINFYPHTDKIIQLHFCGDDDVNTPCKLVRESVSPTASNAKVINVKGYNHNCCWHKGWPNQLSAILKMIPRH